MEKEKKVTVKEIRQQILKKLHTMEPATPEYNELMEILIKLDHEINEGRNNTLKSISGIAIPVIGFVFSALGTLYCTKWEDGSIMSGTAGKKHMNNLLSWPK